MLFLFGIFLLSVSISCQNGGGGNSGPNEIYVVVGISGRIMTSPDGATWTDETEAGDWFQSITNGSSL